MITAEPILLHVEEAADILRLGRTRIYDLIRTGQLNSVKIAGSRRIPRQALDNYVAALIQEDQK